MLAPGRGRVERATDGKGGSMKQLVIFSKGEKQVAINPSEISDVLPMRDAGWTLITMKNRVEHAVAHEFAVVVDKINVRAGL